MIMTSGRLLVQSSSHPLLVTAPSFLAGSLARKLGLVMAFCCRGVVGRGGGRGIRWGRGLSLSPTASSWKACRFPEPIDDYRAMAFFPRPPHSEFTHHRWEAVSGFSFRATPLDPRIQVLHI